MTFLSPAPGMTLEMMVDEKIPLGKVTKSLYPDGDQRKLWCLSQQSVSLEEPSTGSA